MVPLRESPVGPWSDESSKGTGWFRMFVEFAALLWATVVLGVLITHRDGPTGARGLDRHIAQWVADHRTAWMTRLAEMASAVGSVTALIPVAAIVGLLVWRRTGRAGIAAFPLVALIDTEVIVHIAKRIVDRPRPLPSLASSTFGGFAWPSGHAASAMAAAASACVVVNVLGCSKALQRRVGVTAGFFAVLVAASRVVLGAHWTTDVLMGGVVGLTVVILLGRPLITNHAELGSSE